MSATEADRDKAWRISEHCMGGARCSALDGGDCDCGVDELREDIAEALAAEREAARAFVAKALRAAAQDQRAEADNVPDTYEGTHADGHRCAANFLDRHAEALDHRNRR